MRRSLLPLVLLSVAIVFALAGYAYAGFNDPAPIVIAATATPMPAATAQPTATLPFCIDPTVQVGTVCLPVYRTPPPCAANQLPDVPPVPCLKNIQEH